VDFGILPPEVNSGRMYAGPGSQSMVAAAAAWEALGAEFRRDFVWTGGLGVDPRTVAGSRIIGDGGGSPSVCAVAGYYG